MSDPESARRTGMLSALPSLHVFVKSHPAKLVGSARATAIKPVALPPEIP